MKTIALDEKTFSALEELKKKQMLRSFNELLVRIIEKERNVPKSMFGAFKKAKAFKTKDREKMWKE